MQRRRTSGGAAAAAAWTSVLLAVALVSGCSGGDGTSADETSVTVPAATATGSSTTPATTTSTTAPVTTSPATTPTPVTTRWPKALGEPHEGESAWAVYLAVAHSSSDRAMSDAQDEVAKVGYGAVIGDLACDRGSIEALGLDPHDYWTGAVLYFGSKKDADDFAASYLASGGTVIGTAKIGLGCLD
jgi:cell division septation protein DedD